LFPIWRRACVLGSSREAKELGGFARKGEKGTKVVYANSFKKTEEDEQGNELEREIPYLKEYTVFNANQIGRQGEDRILASRLQRTSTTQRPGQPGQMKDL